MFVLAALVVLTGLWALGRRKWLEEQPDEAVQPVRAEPGTRQPVDLLPEVTTPARSRVMIPPRRYQEAIFDELASGAGNVVVNAVAGSGKSTTIRQGVTKVRGRRLLVSFNKAIAKENAEKVGDPQVKSRTLHSVGYECVRTSLRRGIQVNFQKHKYSELAKDLFSDIHERNAFVELVNLIRSTLTNHLDSDAVAELVAYHGLYEVTDEMIMRASSVITTGNQQAQDGLIDFTDQIYLPAFMQLSAPRKFDWLFCDELQDLNAAHADLLKKLLAENGRFIGVGDPRQSIMGFAGAAANSFYELQKRFDAKEMPLSITYRCPKQVVRLAQQYVPHLEAADNAIEGVVRYIRGEDIVEAATVGDLILCRSNAPLLRECIEIIRRGIPARVIGRTTGESLVAIVKKVTKSNRGHFSPEALDEYHEKEIATIKGRHHSEEALQKLEDKIMSIKACWAGCTIRTGAAFSEYITSLFSDGREAVTLSSIHKAKGLENGRVFILEHDTLPCYFFATTEWQREQEKNLVYVAYTRPKEELVLVSKRKEEASESNRPEVVSVPQRRRRR